MIPTLRRHLLLLLPGLTGWPALAQFTAATAPTQHVDVGARVARDDAAGQRQKLTTARTPLVGGDNDISNPKQNWFPLVGQIPNAHLIVYPESGHGPQHQYPELTAQFADADLRYAVH